MHYVNEILELLLIFIRVVGFIVSAPLFGTKYIPTRIKIYLALLLAMILSGVYKGGVESITSVEVLVFQSIANLLMGMMVGLLLKVSFHFLTLGGHIIAMGSGLGFATLADPVNGNQVTTIASFYKMIGSLLFVHMGGVVVLVSLIANSFDVLSLQPKEISVISVDYVMQFFIFCFENALLLAAPMVFCVFLVNLSFGVISKASPGLNVFSIGFPVGIWLTFLIMYMTIDTLPYLVERFILEVPKLLLGAF